MAEGFVTLPSVRLFYRTIGRGEPLVFLHGGPAARHNYFLPWVKPLAKSFKLVFYDQRGSGRSSKARDRRYDFRAMCQDLDAVRRKLRLGRINLLGHSWGGSLALEYALSRPSALRRLILADTFASGKQINLRLRIMWNGATPQQRAILSRHERRGLFKDGPAYPAAYLKTATKVYEPYYLKHMKKVPRELANLKIEYDVYRQIWGEDGEFRVTGYLKDFDAMPRLSRLPMPALVLAGRDDQAGPEDARRIAERIPRGECMIFERSGHFPFIDQQGLFLAVIEDFLEGT